MSEQLAGLDIGMESTSVDTANQRLEKFAPNVAKAERATDSLNASTRQGSSALMAMVASIERAIREQNEFIRGMAEGAAAATREAAAMNDLGRATTQMAAQTQKSADIIDLAQRRAARAHTMGAAGAKLQAHEVTNLGRQFADVGVMLASGQNPFMTLLQQGPQIADILHTSGLSAKQFGAEIIAMAAPFAGIIATAGVAVGAFALFANTVDDNSKMALTWGDTWKATVKVVGDAIMDGPIGDGLKWLGGAFTATLKAITDATFVWLERAVGFWGAAYEAVVKNWKRLPEVFAVIMQAAVNNGIWAVEGLVNAVIKGINKLAGKDLISALELPRLKVISGQVADSFEKDQARIAAAFHDGREKMFKDIVTEAERIHAAGEKKKKATEGETAATKALRDAMEDLLRTRRAGLALDNQMARVRDNMPTRENLESSIGRGVAAQAAKDQKEWNEGLLAIKRQQLALAESYTARLKYSRQIETLMSSEVQALTPQQRAREDTLASYRDLNDNLMRATDAMKAGDFGAAVPDLISAFKGLKDAAAAGGDAIRGAIAGIANVAGSLIGGTAGSTISGAAQGYASGGIVGAFFGGIGGFLSGKKKEREAKERAEAAEAERLARVADERRGIEIQLLQAQGDAVGALNLQRQGELAAMDATNRALAEQLYAAQDAAEVQAKAAEAAAALAAAEKALSDQRRSLDIQLADATGDAVGALAMRRADELAAMDASLRSIQSAIWAANDLAAANDNLATSLATLSDLQAQQAMQAQQASVQALQAIAEAAKAELDAANTAADTAKSNLQGLVDGLNAFATTVRAFRDQLMAADQSGASAYASTRSAFYAKAANPQGDAAGLVSSAQAFVEASRNNARTLLDFQRDKAGINAALALAEDAAGEQADIGQQQLDALGTVNNSVLSVGQAVSALAAATAAQAIALARFNGANGQATDAAAALASTQAAQQAAQQAAALAAAQKGVNDAGAAGGQNWASYGTHYSDVAAAYATDPNGQAAGRTAEQWYKFHYDAVGKAEGRTPYAMGGYTGPGGMWDVAGTVHRGEVVWSQADVADAGGVANVEAMRRGDRSGGNDNSEMVAELRGLRAEAQQNTAETRALRVQVAGLKEQLAGLGVSANQTAANTAKTANVLTRVTRDGKSLLTEAA